MWSQLPRRTIQAAPFWFLLMVVTANASVTQPTDPRFSLPAGTVRSARVGDDQLAVVGLADKVFEQVCLAGGSAILQGFSVNWFGFKREKWLFNRAIRSKLFVKLRLYEVATRSVPPNTILILTDTFDSVFLSTPRRVVDSFRAMEAISNTHVFLGAEKTVWPFHYEVYKKECTTFRAEYVMDQYAQMAKRYNLQSKTQYLNSGSIIGRAGHLLTFLELARNATENSEIGCHDDQAILTIAMLRNQTLSRLDYNSSVFFMGYPGYEDVWMSSDTLMDSVSRSPLGIVHANGLKWPLLPLFHRSNLGNLLHIASNAQKVYIDGEARGYQSLCGAHVQEFKKREEKLSRGTLTGRVVVTDTAGKRLGQLVANPGQSWSVSAEDEVPLFLSRFEVVYLGDGAWLALCNTIQGCLALEKDGLGSLPLRQVQTDQGRAARWAFALPANKSRILWGSHLFAASVDGSTAVRYVAVHFLKGAWCLTLRAIRGAAFLRFEVTRGDAMLPDGVSILSEGYWRFLGQNSDGAVDASAMHENFWDLFPVARELGTFRACRNHSVSSCLTVDGGNVGFAGLWKRPSTSFRLVGVMGSFMLAFARADGSPGVLQSNLATHLATARADGPNVRSLWRVRSPSRRQHAIRRPFSVGLLLVHFRKVKQLRATLESWQRGGLLDFVDERLVHIHQCGSQKRQMLERFGFTVYGSSDVRDVGTTFDHLVTMAQSDTLMVMEEDFVLAHDHSATEREMLAGISLLLSGKADVVRYRSRLAPGEPDYAAQWLQFQPLSVYAQPGFQHDLFCNSFHWTNNLEQVDAEGRARRCLDSPRYMCFDSYWCNWTNNPSLFLRTWWLRAIHPLVANCKLTTAELKKHSPNDCFELRMYSNASWWSARNFTVALGDGLFTHNNNMNG